MSTTEPSDVPADGTVRTGRSPAIEVLRVLAPGLVLMLLGTLGFLGLLDSVREHDDLSRLDQPILEWFAGHRTPWLTSALTVVTTIFGPVVLPIVVAVVCGVWGLRTHRWRDPALLAGSMVVATVLSSVVKALVERPRPADDLMTVPGVETSFSFPSGHTICAATLVLVGGYLVWSHHRTARVLVGWCVVTVLVITLVAGSRLYLGYHFVTDVLAGVCLAVVVLGIVVVLSGWLGVRDERHAREVQDGPDRQRA